MSGMNAFKTLFFPNVEQVARVCTGQMKLIDELLFTLHKMVPVLLKSTFHGPRVLQQKKHLPYHVEIVSSNPSDSTAICDQEPNGAKLAMLSRTKGVSLFSHSGTTSSCHGKCMD